MIKPMEHIRRSLMQTKQGLAFKLPKTESSERCVDVPLIAATALLEHKAEQQKIKEKKGKAYKDQGLIFAGPDGSPIKPDSLSNNFFRVVKKAGFGHREFSFHSLRHTYASHLIDDGELINEVAKALGHSDVRTTLGIYAHRIRARKTGIGDRIQRLLTQRPDEGDDQAEDSLN